MEGRRIVVVFIVVIAVAAVIIGAVVTEGTMVKKSPPPVGSVSQSVEILNFAFHQPNIQIKANTSVRWYNNDSMAHTVTSLPGAPVTFDSGVLNPGSTYTYTFTQPGTYSYYCKIHPFMLGNVTVTA